LHTLRVIVIWQRVDEYDYLGARVLYADPVLNVPEGLLV